MKFLKKAGVGIACAGLMLAIHGSQSAMDTRHSIRFVDLSPVFLPKGRVLKACTMGYRSAVADALWMKSVLYYGRRVIDDDNPYYVYAEKKGTYAGEMEAVQKRGTAETADPVRRELQHILNKQSSRGLVTYIYPLLQRVADLDPQFLFPYIFGGVYVLLDTGDINEAEALLLKGYKANPGAWQFPFYLGWISWMYRGDRVSTYRFLQRAIAMDDCPSYVKTLYTGLSRELGKKQEAALYLESLIESTDNMEMKEQLAETLEQLRKEL